MDVNGILYAALSVLLFVSLSRGQTMPTPECTYDSGLYTCDYSLLSTNSKLPLAADTATFNPIPQRLKLTEVSGTLSGTFASTFGTMSTANYDTNYPASLEIVCKSGTTVTINADFLNNMPHLMWFKFTNCALGTVGAALLEPLGSLDYFAVERGSITSLDASWLRNITIDKQESASPTFPEKIGQLSMKYVTFTNSPPYNFISSQTSLHSVVLEGLGLTTIDNMMFSGLSALRSISLSNNAFTTLPDGLFNGLTELSEVYLYGTTWDCTCSNLWFVKYAIEQNITIYGDLICSSGGLAWGYYQDNCVTVTPYCNDDILIGGACLTPIDLTAYCVGSVAFILGWVVLGLSICNMKKLSQGPGGARGKGAKIGAKKKPPPGKSPRGPKKGWA